MRWAWRWCIQHGVKRQTHDKPGWELPPEAGLGCVGYRVRRLSRGISAIYDEAFGPLKLKLSQFGILAMLSRRGPSTAVDLCRLVMMDKSTASRNLQRMRRRRWISLVQESAGSGQKVCLTPEGAQVLQQAYPLWRRAQDEAMRRLGATGLKALDMVVARMKQ
jgi:DNA-binding MarR family transcriptional regulator